MNDVYDKRDIHDELVKEGEVFILNDRNFEKEVMKSKDLWIVFFYVPWCEYCKAAAPHFADAATRLKGKVKFGKVDGDAVKELPPRFGVTSYPAYKVWGRYGDGKTD